MRIISGRLKGRPIVAPAGRTTRPTSDRARQALFDVLTHAPWAPDLEAARVIDLFAGSGALGLEAISRGAAFCLFVDTDENARGAVRRNIESLGLFGQTRLHRRDACDLGPRPASAGGPFRIAFLDPPYHQGLGERAALSLLEGGWLEPEALVVVERAILDPVQDLTGLETLDQRSWGPARVVFSRAI